MLIPALSTAIGAFGSFASVETDSVGPSPTVEIDSVRLDEICLEGNTKTKDYVLLNEIRLQEGDRIAVWELPYRMETARRLLINTSLFSDVEVDWLIGDDQSLYMEVNVRERWYVFPVPIFELADRNFNTWWTTFDHDFKRVNIGINLILYNMTGHHDDMNIISQWGFTPKFELFYRRPYVGRSDRHGMGFFVSAATNKKFPIRTEDNMELFYQGDDFGLTRLRGGVQYLLRDGLYQFHTTELKYNYNRITDTVATVNPAFFGAGRTTQQFATLSYNYTYNRVDNKAYPLQGIYGSLTARKIGLGWGDLNQWSLIARWNQYLALGWKSYLGYQVKVKTTLADENPYYNLEGMGYCQDMVRGYELYVVDGQHYGFAKFNLKRHLFGFGIPNPLSKNPRYGKVPFDFYLKGYVDAGYVVDAVYEEGNPLTNHWMLGYGLGIDVVTFYDWVFRVEYSFNREGENGLFLHFVLDLNTYEDCRLW